VNQEIKEKWVAALRSGEYKQGTGRLRIEIIGGYQYCCLGVLCDIVAEAEPDKYVWDHRTMRTPGGSYGSVAVPTHMEIELFLSGADPIVRYNDRSEPLSVLNDIHRLNFNQIADIIEAQL